LGVGFVDDGVCVVDDVSMIGDNGVGCVVISIDKYCSSLESKGIKLVGAIRV
jgi:hypothetical protein